MPFLEEEHLNMVPRFLSGRKPVGRDCSISMRIAPLRQVSGISDFNGVHLLWLCKSWCWVWKSFLLENLILTCEVIHFGPL